MIMPPLSPRASLTNFGESAENFELRLGMCSDDWQQHQQPDDCFQAEFAKSRDVRCLRQRVLAAPGSKILHIEFFLNITLKNRNVASNSLIKCA